MRDGAVEPRPPGTGLSKWRGAGAWRRAALGLLVLGVVVAHGCVADRVGEHLSELKDADSMPRRIEVAYVRELEIKAPVVSLAQPLPPKPRPRPRKAAAAPIVDAAASSPEPAADAASAVSAAASAADEPASAASELAVAADLPASQPAAPEAAAAASMPASSPVSTAAAASAPSAEGFGWPASTRVSYVLEGNYRGEIHGKAFVEWARAGDDRYQVHLDVTIGLPFAPLMTRHMSSEGRITPDGLWPERFDQDSKRAFADRQRASMRFERDAVVLADGQRVARPPGLQDSTSQFIQLTYLFTRQPQLLVPGGALVMPLALPRRVSQYIYDVAGNETVWTPFGTVETVHLKPRRVDPAPGELAVEIWYAPSLRYLPVRIKLRQDADTFIDLVIERKPELAAP